MRVQEMRQKTEAELQAQLQNLRKELFDLRFQSSSEQIENPSRIREIRKTIARIKTVESERARQTETES